MSAHDVPDPELQDLQDRYDTVTERMERFELALRKGEMEPDRFLWYYHECVATRQAIACDMVRLETRAREPERVAERSDRPQVQDRPTGPARDDDKPSPAEPRRVDLSGPLSLDDIRAAVRQSQQEASRQQDADERQRQEHERQDDRDLEDGRRR